MNTELGEDVIETSDFESDDEEMTEIPDVVVSEDEMDEIRKYLSEEIAKICDQNLIPFDYIFEPVFRLWVRSLVSIGAKYDAAYLKELFEDI